MSFIDAIKNKITGKSKTQGYASTVRSHVIGEEKKPPLGKQPRRPQAQPGPEGGVGGARGAGPGRRFPGPGREREAEPRAPTGPGPEEMPATGQGPRMERPEPSLEPMPLERQGGRTGPEGKMQAGAPQAPQPKAVEKPGPKPPEPVSVPGKENKQEIILDEVRFLKSELSAIKSQLDAVNERLKNLQRGNQRRY